VAKHVNCYSDYRFQVDITTPDSTGELAQPSLGAITGILLRLSATETGAALNAAVDALAASETAGTAGRFYYSVDTSLLQSYVLPLGVGASFYAIWSKTNDMDMKSVRFIVADRDKVT
jgi:hypothetical protein